MKLIIFGSTGTTGRVLTQTALDRGHQVTAFVRNPEAMDIRHPQLHVVRGDVLDPQSVERAIKGHDAVLVTLGMPARKAGTLRSDGTKNIVAAMRKSGVRRIVCMASLGYGDSAKVLDYTSRFFRWVIVPFLLRDAFEDHARQELHVRESGLDWVIVRPGNLTDGPAMGAYKHGDLAGDPSIKVQVSRSDVADFMLKQLDDDIYLGRTPGISD